MNESIRKKHRALKTGMIDDDIAVRTHLGPIIEPLQKIVDNSSMRVVKDEPDVAVEVSSTPKREPDVGFEILRAPKCEKKTVIRTGIKRKLVNGSLGRKSHKSKQLRIESSDAPDAPTITSTPLTMIGTVQSPMNLPTKDESVFETTNESFATSVQQEVQTPKGQEALRAQLGPLSQKYVEAVIRGDKDIDNVYGVYLSNDEIKFGCKRFDVDHEDHIILDNVRYKGISGLYELVFKRLPDDIVYTDDDLEKYRSMLLVTNAYRRDHSARGQVKSNRGHKYKYIIAPLLSTEPKTKSGRGLPRAMTLNDNAIDYVHWDDPNELVERLRLLNASRQAENNSHDNEMLSIIEELREAGLIIN
ncbi:hypothetical protein X777_03235 [Ooceraea biroi]|uniref:DUF8207 domain-containing protein n=1 Tax=Ooceraea biroi TaxID=2015173 RepID=A0A026WL56_OOCBI|nr:hypothetical protein X777_03235 [Ooceraea biroi]